LLAEEFVASAAGIDDQPGRGSFRIFRIFSSQQKHRTTTIARAYDLRNPHNGIFKIEVALELA
jgi:hypothetical protein